MSSPTVVCSDTRTQSWQAHNRRDLADLIPAVRRHSRVVGILRRAIPAAGVIGILCLLIAPAVTKLNLPKLPVKIGIMGTKITMEIPHMSGVTRDGREYQVSADAAAQDLTKPDILELSGIRGKILAKDNTAMTLSAISGVYAAKLKLLSLTRHIDIVSSDGKHAELSEAQIETDNGHVISRKPVKVDFEKGNISANELEIFNNGELVRFAGSVIFTTRQTPGSNPRAQAYAAKDSNIANAQGPPTRIESETLEVRDKDHVATFANKVRAVKGDSILKCETLVIEYEGTASSESSSDHQIHHIDAKGGVILTQKDQVATADTGAFDPKSNTGTLLGHVKVTQGENVTRGDRLVVDLDTGVSRVETLNGSHERVESVFSPKRDNENTGTINKGERKTRPTPQPLQLHGR